MCLQHVIHYSCNPNHNISYTDPCHHVQMPTLGLTGPCDLKTQGYLHPSACDRCLETEAEANAQVEDRYQEKVRTMGSAVRRVRDADTRRQERRRRRERIRWARIQRANALEVWEALRSRPTAHPTRLTAEEEAFRAEHDLPFPTEERRARQNARMRMSTRGLSLRREATARQAAVRQAEFEAEMAADFIPSPPEDDPADDVSVELLVRGRRAPPRIHDEEEEDEAEDFTAFPTIEADADQERPVRGRPAPRQAADEEEEDEAEDFTAFPTIEADADEEELPVTSVLHELLLADNVDEILGEHFDELAQDLEVTDSDGDGADVEGRRVRRRRN